MLSYRDGDFSLSLAPDGPRELALLTRLHAELGLALREQRQHLAQRELLLDTVVQNTPVALVLTTPSGRIAIANLAARQLIGDGRSLNGLDFGAVIAGLPDALREALSSDGDRLFAVTLPDGSEETFHHSTRTFRLQGQPHQLRLLRRMTRELSRAEVATWKRVIRVLSHELNNSLAPISSLAHSGAELARRDPEHATTYITNAAQARTQTHAANLDHHGQSASAVATAANTAANEVRQVKSQLSELRSTLGQYGMTVDANSSRVLPPTNMSSLSTANRKLVQEAAKTGQQSLDKLRQAADQADDLLASAMTASNGNELRGIDGGKVGQDDGPHRPYPGQTLPVSNHDDFDLDTQFNRAVGDTKSPMPVGSARSWAQCDGNWCAG